MAGAGACQYKPFLRRLGFNRLRRDNQIIKYDLFIICIRQTLIIHQSNMGVVLLSTTHTLLRPCLPSRIFSIGPSFLWNICPFSYLFFVFSSPSPVRPWSIIFFFRSDSASLLPCSSSLFSAFSCSLSFFSSVLRHSSLFFVPLPFTPHFVLVLRPSSLFSVLQPYSPLLVVVLRPSFFPFFLLRP